MAHRALTQETALILDQDGGDGFAGHVTLDQIFRRVAARHPLTTALVDGRAPDGHRTRLSFAEAEAAIAALAERLALLNLPLDSVIGVQGPAGPAHVLALLACQRAGLIPMLLPELWRDLDLVPALKGSSARALLATNSTLGDLHTRVAAEVFGVRIVCAMADAAADGVLPLGSPATLAHETPAAGPGDRAGDAAAHVAVLTWDVTGDGPHLVPRSHRALVAAGVPVLIEGRFDADMVLVDTLAPSSLGGLAAAVLPWLLTGGTLVFEAPFDAADLAATLIETGATHLAVPADVGAALVGEGRLAGTSLQSLLLLDRTPEAVPQPIADGDGLMVVDVTAFGEAAIVARRRTGDLRRATIPSRTLAADGAHPTAALVHGHRTLQGTLALAGTMVPSTAFPAAAGTGLPLIAEGALDTGWSCRVEPGGATLVCDAPPRGVARVGGYRFGLRDVEGKLAARLQTAVDVTTVPHRVLGQRILATTTECADSETPAATSPLIGLSVVGARRSAS